MISYIHQSLLQFFDRNIFERLVIYLFLSQLLVKIIFEFGLGQDPFLQSQNAQWIFYGFLGLDYLLSLQKTLNINVTLNPISLFALFLFILMAHGLFMGILNHNRPFIILNDTVPLLMMALNILRIQSVTEMQHPVDFERLFKFCVGLSIAMVIFGFLAGKIEIKPTTLYFPMLLAAIFALKPPPYIWVIVGVLAGFLVLDDLNRTSIAFLGVSSAAYIGLKSLNNPIQATMIAAAIIMVALVGWNFVPKDSKTYTRITNLQNVDLSERTGAIGERQAEQDAVTLKLEKTGPAAQWLGLGFGGVYEVARTHGYLTDYGHAHYAWVWFNLRFGYMGYIYLAIMVAALMFNAAQSFAKRDALGVFVGLICVLCLIYCLTYVNAIFLLSGLSFFYRPRLRRAEEVVE